MPALDIFKSDAFTTTSLTTALQKTPYQPQLLGQLGIFEPVPISTKSVMIEEREGKLSLIQTSQRGAPLAQRETEKRKARSFPALRIAKGDTIMADELQGVRAFGSENELMAVQAEIARRYGGPTGILRDVELTWENMRLGAVQGIVTDADGSTLFNWFTEFGVSQAAEIDFDLDNGSPASGAVRKNCNAVVRAMQRAAQGAWVPGTRVIGLCGDNFFDDLTAHPEVRQTYLNTQAAAELRDGNAFGTFNYGGITWTNYRGTDDGSTVAVNTDKAKFFPAGAPGVFQVAWAPAEFMPYVNTLGLPVYGMIVIDKDREAWAKPEVYSYPLFYCTRPTMLQRAKRT